MKDSGLDVIAVALGRKGGGGGGGSTNYNDLSNKPKIGGVELSGNKNITELGGVQSFNGRSGSILPIAGDYSADQVNYDSNKTVKQVIDALATKETSDITGQQSLLKDTVGWTGKNLLKKSHKTTVTNNGITFVFNADGSVTFSGTTPSNANAEVVFDSPDTSLEEMRKISDIGTDLILSGSDSADSIYCVEAIYRTSESVYISDERAYNGDRKLTVPANAYYLRIAVMVKAGNTISTPTTVYPMLRKADITDPTYEPYHESVEVMYEEEIHGVNLLKNKFVSGPINGITWTQNADGTVTADGMAESQNSQNSIIFTFNKSFNAIFSGCPAGGGTYASFKYDIYIWDMTADERAKKWDGITPVDSDYGNTDREVKIVAGRSYAMTLRVLIGNTVSNLVFKPMLRKADIDDPTYRPYNEQAIQNQLNAQGVLGAKNLLPYPYAETTLTKNGITITINSDGSVTANGTATEQARFMLALQSKFTLPSGDYILTDGTSDSANATYFIDVAPYKNGAWIQKQYNTVNGVRRFTLNSSEYDGINIYIQIRSGITVSNLVFKPMLRLASDPDDTYQPYAMTNRELTDIATQTEVVTLSRNTSNTTGADIKLFRYGKLRILTGFIAPTVEDTSQADEHSMVAANLSSNDTPQDYARGLLGRMGTVAGVVMVYPDGKLQFTSSTTQNVYFNIAWIAK